jgi:hypothetical protein
MNLGASISHIDPKSEDSVREITKLALRQAQGMLSVVREAPLGFQLQGRVP